MPASPGIRILTALSSVSFSSKYPVSITKETVAVLPASGVTLTDEFSIIMGKLIIQFQLVEAVIVRSAGIKTFTVPMVLLELMLILPVSVAFVVIFDELSSRAKFKVTLTTLTRTVMLAAVLFGGTMTSV